MVDRRTIVVRDRFAQTTQRLEAARRRDHGVGILTIEQMVGRLAGGFCRSVADDELKDILRTILPQTELGELSPIKDLPGMVSAAASTLRKIWLSGSPLSPDGEDHTRLDALRRLETAIMAALPKGCLRPGDLAAAARARVDHAPAVLGPVTILGVPDLPPCWREVVLAIASRVPVTWVAGPCPLPEWLNTDDIKVDIDLPKSPVIEAYSSATPRHEVIEALRWARQLMASGRARPEEIAIVACRTADYDDAVLALRSEANFDIRFLHGVPATSVREGQIAAALADILVRGLSQDGMRRLTALCRGGPGLLGPLPRTWTSIMPRNAPLTEAAAWERMFKLAALDNTAEVSEWLPLLREIIVLLARGTHVAEEVGESLLGGLPRQIWRRALIEGPTSAIDLTIAALRLEDEGEVCSGVVWGPASSIAASPRPFVRLLGLSSRGWPQAITEDRLLPDHVVPLHILDPRPRPIVDKGDFDAILATTSSQVVLSRPRRGPDGRLLGESPLVRPWRKSEIYLGRNRVPDHAVGHIDRLTARPEEFGATGRAKAALSCWTAWANRELTAHDGRIRPDHPVILAILDRIHSATSLRKLLRDPAAFVWQYGVGMRAVDSGAELLALDPRDRGTLIHQVLEHAVDHMERGVGFANAGHDHIRDAVNRAIASVEGSWTETAPTPPPIVLRRTLVDAADMALAALSHREHAFAGQRTSVEVPFGGRAPKSELRPVPWDRETIVTIPSAGFRIAGYIDRLDLGDDGRSARVRDYKTGRAPKTSIVLDGGKELQRCLYGYAARSLLGSDVVIEASLLYPADGICLGLDDADRTLEGLAGHLAAARESLRSGNAFAGPDAKEDWNEHLFALPANALRTYAPRKNPGIREALAEAADVWDAA